MTPFKVLYGYDLELRIDITSAKDTATKGEAPAIQYRILRLHELQERFREQLLLS